MPSPRLGLGNVWDVSRVASLSVCAGLTCVGRQCILLGIQATRLVSKEQLYLSLPLQARELPEVCQHREKQARRETPSIIVTGN